MVSQCSDSASELHWLALTSASWYLEEVHRSLTAAELKNWREAGLIYQQKSSPHVPTVQLSSGKLILFQQWGEAGWGWPNFCLKHIWPAYLNMFAACLWATFSTSSLQMHSLCLASWCSYNVELTCKSVGSAEPKNNRVKGERVDEVHQQMDQALNNHHQQTELKRNRFSVISMPLTVNNEICATTMNSFFLEKKRFQQRKVLHWWCSIFLKKRIIKYFNIFKHILIL